MKICEVKNNKKLSNQIYHKGGFARLVDFGFVFEKVNTFLNNIIAKINISISLPVVKSKTFSKPKFTTGFALLFSVLISSLLLTIGLSIFNIALKELAISIASQRSIHAFYAADSGRECALYWDVKAGMIPTMIPGFDGGKITCNGTEFDVSASSDYIDGSDVSIISEIKGIKIKDTAGANTNVFITKSRNFDSTCGTQAICTTVTATGWNSDGGDRVEREIREDY